MSIALRSLSDARILVRGTVIHGDRRGRQLGFPTANMALDPAGVGPADGVYAGYARLADGRVERAAVSVGRRATFYGDDGVRLLEAHLLDFSDDLYDQEVTIEIVTRLRGQLRFDGVGHLMQQLRGDIARCHEVLSAVAGAYV